jgi:phosphohistidine phosphatase
MITLYLMRHGIAQGASGQGDSERALTASGLALLEKMTGVLKTRGVRLDVIFCSPLTRAQQTAEALKPLLEDPNQWFIDEDLRPGTKAQQVIDLLHGRTYQNILMVGHQPDLTEIAAELLHPNSKQVVGLRPGNMMAMEFDKVVDMHAGTLQWLLAPEEC